MAVRHQLDVSQLMMRLRMAIVARALFSADISRRRMNQRSLNQVFELFEARSCPFPVARELPLPPCGGSNGPRSPDQIVYRLIAQRRASGRDTGDCCRWFAEPGRDDSGKPAAASPTSRCKRDEALTLLLAGYETTANALT